MKEKLIWILIPPATLLAVSSLVALAFEAAGMGEGNGLLMTVIADAVCLPLFAWMGRRRGLGRDESTGSVRKGDRKGRFRILLLLLAAGMVCSVLGGRLFTALGLYDTYSNEAQEALLAAPLMQQWIGLVCIVPLCEELCYRNLCYGQLRREIPRPLAAVLVSALFALAHGNMIQGLYAFPMGLLLAGCYELTGDVTGPIFFHVGANLISVVVSALGDSCR